MASVNETYRLIAKALVKSGYVENEKSVAQSNHALYLRLRDRVFRINVDAVEQIDNAKDSESAGTQFMATQPIQFDKDGNQV